MGSRSTKVSGRGGAGCLLVVALFWNGLVGVFDVMIVGAAVRSVQAQQSWEPMQASILESRVEARHSDDGTTYRPVVRYRYRVGPEVHVSDRVSFLSWGTSDRGWAEEIQERYPLGSTVTGYHDPEEPSSAALDISTDTIPPFAVLFLLPFHVIGFGIILGVIAAWRSRDDDEEAALRKRFVVVDRGGHVVLRRPTMGPRLAFTIALFGTSFVSTFASLAFGGPGAGWPVMLVFLAICVALSTGAAVYAQRRCRRPDRHLHIDHGSGLFAFPADAEGVPVGEVDELQIQSQATNVTVNDVRQYEHRLVAIVAGRPHDVFTMRGGPGDGDEIKDLVEAEFARAGRRQRSSAAAA